MFVWQQLPHGRTLTVGRTCPRKRTTLSLVRDAPAVRLHNGKNELALLQRCLLHNQRYELKPSLADQIDDRTQIHAFARLACPLELLLLKMAGEQRLV